MFNRTPKCIKARPRTMHRIEGGQRVLVSRSLAKELGIPEFLAFRVIKNVIFRVICAQRRNASFITDRSQEIDFLEMAGGSTAISKRNRLAERHLTTLVPFLEDVPLSSLLDLRRKEGDSFVRFRAALRDCMEDFLALGEDPKENSVRELYGDRIAPELARIDQVIATSRRNILKGLVGSAAGAVGALSFGVMLGTVNPTLGEVVKSLGIVQGAGKAVKELIDAVEGESAVRSDPFYFLWKVRKAAKIRMSD